MPKFLFEVKYLEGGVIGRKEIEVATYDDACDLIDEVEKDIFIENGVEQKGSYQTVIVPVK